MFRMKTNLLYRKIIIESNRKCMPKNGTSYFKNSPQNFSKYNYQNKNKMHFNSTVVLNNSMKHGINLLHSGGTVAKNVHALSPYMDLMRFHRPVGTFLTFWPCSWSIALSATPGSFPDIYYLSLFAIGSFLMRGAGCTINDMLDRDIDAKVERTKNRPLVKREISNFDTWNFLAAQLGLALVILLQLNWNSIILGVSCLGFVIVYPIMKRITYWPQLFLGLTLNWGALLGWCCIHGTVDWHICFPLYFAGICWTIFYDTIYAHQDKLEDIAQGTKSTAIRFGEKTQQWIFGFATAMVANLSIVGLFCAQTWPYYASIGMITMHMLHQIRYLNIHSPKDCAEKWRSNNYLGLILFTGIIMGTYKKGQLANQISENLKVKTQLTVSCSSSS